MAASSVVPVSTVSLADILSPAQTGLDAVSVRLSEVAPDQHPALTAATGQLLTAGGKRLRPALALLSCQIFDADTDLAVALAAAVEMLHTATLVHDDLIDGSLLRRGIATLNSNWSPDATVLTGDYLFARAASFAAQTGSVRVMELFANTLMVIVNGEIQQKYPTGKAAPGADYYKRIYAKTASLFVLAAEAGGELGGAAPAHLDALRTYGREVGTAFQIVDDVLDFSGSADRTGKTAGSDLRQGLITLPLLHYSRLRPQDADAQAVLRGETVDRVLSDRLVSAVCNSAAIRSSLNEAREFARRGQAALQNLPDCSAAGSLLAIAEFIVDRDL